MVSFSPHSFLPQKVGANSQHNMVGQEAVGFVVEDETRQLLQGLS